MVVIRPASLGVTCKDAFVVFSQNETLELQRQLAALEADIAHWKKRHQKQKQRVEWAREMLRKYNIRCRCNYGDCEECFQESNDCTCQIKTCNCFGCGGDGYTSPYDGEFHEDGSLETDVEDDGSSVSS